MSDRKDDRPIAILAFDHRSEFSRFVLGVDADDLSHDKRRQLSEAKELIFDAFLTAVGGGDLGARTGILVDEEYGANVLRRAQTRDFSLSIPVERADRDTFEFEYGDTFRNHIRAFAPDYVKALVRYNVHSPESVRELQLSRLRELFDWLSEARISFLFELIVRPTAPQLEQVGGLVRSFEDHVRPALVEAAIGEILGAGIRPQVWKLEGVARREDAEAIAARAAEGGPDVECVVLGAAAEEGRVAQWMKTAAHTAGFNGFAIGRNIWRDRVSAWLAGEATRQDAVTVIAERYRKYVQTYLDHVS